MENNTYRQMCNNESKDCRRFISNSDDEWILLKFNAVILWIFFCFFYKNVSENLNI